MARVHNLEKGNGYGFHLASERGAQFIRKIDPDSPAEKSGIRDGDRLLGVNNDNVLGLSHKEIVELVVGSGEHVSLIVTSSVDGMKLSNTDACRQLMPRQATLYRQSTGFGFVLHSERVHKATSFFLTKIALGGAAWLAGVFEDDKILSIDGTFISNRQHSDVVDLIKNKSEIKMTLMHRSSTLPGDLAQRIQVPCEERISEENATESTDAIEPSVSDTMSKTSTIAEIISPPQSEPVQERIEHLSRTTSESSSSKKSEPAESLDNNNESSENGFDIANMSLEQLKMSVRSKKSSKRRPVDDINWTQNKNLFKEL